MFNAKIWLSENFKNTNVSERKILFKIKKNIGTGSNLNFTQPKYYIYFLYNSDLTVNWTKETK